MRLRHSLAAAAGAAVLILTVPGSAYAAEGDFRYTYIDSDGEEEQATLHDPNSGECVTLPEAAQEYHQPPAHSPKNRTDSFAIVFTNADCSGDTFTLRPHTGGASERLKLRSVLFS
ncbi:hypothetical protein [Streptomyces sp. BA2]|uniref:hypothetical protein n=1 Tax=Streptomyces sp. BA2 TaxID=436595 RepID=UPI001323EC51|nr:hypothetical protein [Streptomyces sp. BA2]MWA15668.1 hypothetical protein [Streptomyces sp. BA2]